MEFFEEDRWIGKGRLAEVPGREIFKTWKRCSDA
jgi:hypothetical protein